MQAVILAGGKGTRLKPYTDNMPKPLVPIKGKPIIVHIIELLKKHGFDELIITLGYRGDMIKAYLGNGSKFGVQITYSFEKEPLGTAGCIKLASNNLEDTFLIISGDAYTDIDLSKALTFHKNHHGDFTIIGKYVNDCRGFGVIKTDNELNVERFLEKPNVKIRGLVNTGIYIFNKKILGYIDDGFCDFARDVFPKIINQLKCYITDEYWSDIGTKESYMEANALVRPATCGRI